MPKRIPENEKRVTLNCLVAPTTLKAINDTIAAEGGSQGLIVDQAVAFLVYGEELGRPAPEPEISKEPAPVPKKAETVAERKKRERLEHIAALAESDVVARAVGRDDIEYDLENNPTRHILNVGQPTAPVGQAKPTYEPLRRKVKPLTRPHGSTEAKRRREQQ